MRGRQDRVRLVGRRERNNGLSPANNVAQIGTTVGIGLLLDTLIVRAFIIPAVAAITRRWFWWPQDGLYRHRSRSTTEAGTHHRLATL